MVAYWIKTILFILAGIGVLLVGFELLSSNITKLCHKGLKKLFNKTAKNDLVGVAIGASTTAIMQSSAATTIMVVGFVNTGVMTLKQAAAVIMGANIGTTVTAQLAALSGFDFTAYAIGLAGIGVFINMLAKKDKVKTFANVLTGFGLLFLGLHCVSLAINLEYEGTLLVKETIANILTGINGKFAPVLLFVLGILITALVQSSALITTIIISLTSAGIYIGSGGEANLTNNVLYLILGTNIGTCVTAMISSVSANTNARRASFIHLLFNTTGALIFIILFVCWPTFMEDTFVKWFELPETQVAMFHTAFNVICTFIFLPFTNIFVYISSKIIKDKKDKNKEVKFTYIDERLLKSPSIAIHMVRKEMDLMYQTAYHNLDRALDGFFNLDLNVKETVDKVNQELSQKQEDIVAFFVKLSNQDITFDDECTIQSFNKSLHDIVRIGEIGDNICKYTRQMVEEELSFSDYVMPQLGLMKQTIHELYHRTEEVFITKNLNPIKDVNNLEEQVDKMRKELIDDHFDRLSKGECHPENSAIFVNLVNNLERSADHMTFIAEAVKEAIEAAN